MGVSEHRGNTYGITPGMRALYYVNLGQIPKPRVIPDLRGNDGMSLFAYCCHQKTYRNPSPTTKSSLSLP